MLLYVDAQYASPYAMSVFVALQEKAIKFTTEVIDLSAGENRNEKYSSISLTQRVPTIVHGGFTLSESSAITEYLDEIFPGNPLYPPESHKKALARQVQAWLRSDLMPIRHERSTEVVFYRPIEQPLSSEAQVAVTKLFKAANELLAHGGDNLFDAWCIADVDLALMLNRLILNGDPVPLNLANYARKQWERPSVRQWVTLQRPSL